MAPASRADWTEPDPAQAADLDAEFAALAPLDRLRLLRDRVAGPLVFTTSFGLEDQALTHLIAHSGVEVALVTLDTGRLFPETYELWARTEARYGLKIRAMYPAAEDLEALVDAQGIDGFRRSKEARLACCAVRKLQPLERALRGAAGWITGLRADQSDNRRGMQFVSFDPARGLLKANPLLDWTRARALAFTQAELVPTNPLHEEGFLSIGCAPCTRAVRPGEDERAGRWWWEAQSAKECGLHLGPDGRLVRAGVPA
jgi:phosphoadenosine phosphosulfate reductase